MRIGSNPRHLYGLALGLLSVVIVAGCGSSGGGTFSNPTQNFALAIAYSPDGRMLAEGIAIPVDEDANHNNFEVRLIDAVSGVKLGTIPLSHSRVAATSFAHVLVWDTTSGNKIGDLGGQAGALWTLAFSPDNNTIATAGDDGAIRLWNSTSGALISTLTGHTSRINSIVYSNDGS